jgi:hypothetical protein
LRRRFISEAFFFVCGGGLSIDADDGEGEWYAGEKCYDDLDGNGTIAAGTEILEGLGGG